MAAKSEVVGAKAVDEKNKEAGDERATWGGQIEFILTLVGYAVGLGNIWRFPYLCYKNGGGAFLIPYFGMLIVVGIPIFYLELAFGQFASLGPIAIWAISPLLKGLGYAMVTINTLVFIYYNVIISWCLYFFFASMASTVPWATCGNSWNTPYCFTSEELRNMSGNGTVINDAPVSKADLKSPTDEYFYRHVLQLSSGIDEMGTIVWSLALCLLLAWIIVFFVLIKGISSLGKVVYLTSTLPYVLLTVMLIRGVTLEGALDGIVFYLKPDFSKLATASVWSDAATQIFFSLSTCTGGLIAMASYNKFSNNCLRDAILVPIINCATSFYGGFAIFSVLGYMALQKGVSVDSVAASGPGLVFVAYPEALSTMPVAPLWSILFFLMMTVLGLSSMFSLVECFFCAFMDEFPSLLRQPPLRALMFRIVGCIVFYFIGVTMVTEGGFYLFNLFDTFVGGFILLVIGFLECATVMYIYGYSNFAEDIKMMLGKKPNIYWRACWCLVSPLILLATMIFLAVQFKSPTLFSGNYSYPGWANGIGWTLFAACIIFIPIFAGKALFENGIKSKMFKNSITPTDDWGPAASEDRTGKYQPQPQHSKTNLSSLELPSYIKCSELNESKKIGSQNASETTPGSAILVHAYDNAVYEAAEDENSKGLDKTTVAF